MTQTHPPFFIWANHGSSAEARQRLAHLSAHWKGRLEWLLEAVKLPDRAAVVQSYIATYGPHLYHCPGDPEDLDDILRQGILPRPLDCQGSWGDLGERWLSRAGHTYLGDFDVMNYHICRLPIIRVDLRLLDPQRLVADEDVFDAGCRDYYEYEFWIEALPVAAPDCFRFRPGNRIPGWDDRGPLKTVPDEHSLSQWADAHAWLLERPQSLAYSLACGTIAHQGAINPSLVELNVDIVGDMRLDEHLGVYDSMQMRTRWRLALES